jgi:hypothetical protein
MADIGVFLTAIAGIAGVAIGAYLNYFFTRRSEMTRAEVEDRRKRYGAILPYMEVYLNPDSIKHLPVSSVESFNIHTREDIRSTLFVEYSALVFFAPDYVLKALKTFIETPNSDNYWKALVEIRRALWGKETKIPLDGLRLRLDGK